jgi:predicted lipoprotein with Yx(FWY)xxD motif
MRRLTWIRAITLAATAVTMCAISACVGREAVSSARSLPGTSSSAAPTSSVAPPSSSQRPPAPTTAAPASTPAQPAESTAPTSASSAAPQSLAAAERLGVTDNPRLGPIVTDGNGMTVYRVDADGTPGFEPVVVPEGAGVEVDGIDPALVGASRLADGGMRLTLAGGPLYRFTGDAAPGETNGHGADGAFAITPTGERAGTTR